MPKIDRPPRSFVFAMTCSSSSKDHSLSNNNDVLLVDNAQKYQSTLMADSRSVELYANAGESGRPITVEQRLFE